MTVARDADHQPEIGLPAPHDRAAGVTGEVVHLAQVVHGVPVAFRHLEDAEPNNSGYWVSDSALGQMGHQQADLPGIPQADTECPRRRHQRAVGIDDA